MHSVFVLCSFLSFFVPLPFRSLCFTPSVSPLLCFFSLAFFWAFLGEGSSKTRFKKMQKAHVKNFFRENSQKIDKNFDTSFPSIFFCFIAFLGVS